MHSGAQVFAYLASPRCRPRWAVWIPLDSTHAYAYSETTSMWYRADERACSATRLVAARTFLPKQATCGRHTFWHRAHGYLARTLISRSLHDQDELGDLVGWLRRA